jgi:peroxiredoxin
MMRIIAYSLLLLAMACAERKQGTRISGTIANAKDRMLYFEELSTGKTILLDSLRLDEDGAFGFVQPISSFKYLQLRIDRNTIRLIADSTGNINVNADADRFSQYTVTGSRDSELLRIFNDTMQASFAAAEDINRRYREADSIGTVNMDSLEAALQKTYSLIMDRRVDYVKRFISKHPSSLVSLTATQFLDINRDIGYYSLVDSALYRNYPSSEYVKEFHGRVSVLVQRLPIGGQAPDIVAKSPSGQTIALSSLKGKIVLVEFWASWCKPCLTELPVIKEMYRKYRSKGLEIYSFSLDTDSKAWEEAIQKHDLRWIQVSDHKKWKSPVVGSYYVDAIPFLLLLDREGKILAKGIEAKELDQLLASLPGNKDAPFKQSL